MLIIATLQAASFLEAKVASVANNDVIKGPNAGHFAGCDKPRRDLDVVERRMRVA